MTALPHDPTPDDALPADAEAPVTWVTATARLLGLMEHDEGSNDRPLGKARKVSVSMPEQLTAAVQHRVGKGEFSQYVTDAVARQLELDLLAELAGLLEAEHGPVPEDLLAEAGAAWPDAE